MRNIGPLQIVPAKFNHTSKTARFDSISHAAQSEKAMSDFNSTHNRAVWFDIPVADLDRAAAFYRAVLGVSVEKQTFGDSSIGVIEHKDGNGGCLVQEKAEISAGGILLYMNVNGRIRDAVQKVVPQGGTVIQPIHPIGPHGFRAVVLDSEGNRIALHSRSDA
jgi:predicted enzyme related to lactoylglutathione lyase